MNFATHEEAANACDELNEKEVNGKKLYVGRAQKKSERKDELQRKYEAIKQEKQNKYQVTLSFFFFCLSVFLSVFFRL